jgi:HSP20 family protein
MSKAHPTREKTHKGAESQQQQQRPKGAAPQAGRDESARGSSLARRQAGGLSAQGYASPFSFMRRFSEEMDRLFDDFGFGGLAARPGPGRSLAGRGAAGMAGWSPQVEMFEREGKLVVRADLPGMKKEDVSVDLDDDVITIRGERRSEHEEDREGYYHSERSYGSFHRMIPLPDGVDGESAKASFRDGVLEITMDAPRRPSGRRLDIEGGDES